MQRRRETRDCRQKFRNVANLSAERFGCGVFGLVVTEEVVVFLQSGSAASRVGDDSVKLREMKCDQIFASDRAGLFAGPGVRRQRTAAALRVGYNHVAAIRGEHADGRLVERRKCDLRHAASEKCHTGAARTDRSVRGAKLIEEKFSVDRRKQRFPSRQTKQIENPGAARQFLQPAALINSQQRRRSGDSLGIWQQLAENKIAREPRKKWPRIFLRDPGASVLHKFAVLHAGGAGGFAGTAVQAFVDVVHEAGGERRGFLRGIALRGLLHADHLPNPSARRISLQIPQPVGGARVEAKPAMHAARVVFVGGDESGDCVGNCARSQSWGGHCVVSIDDTARGAKLASIWN